MITLLRSADWRWLENRSRRFLWGQCCLNDRVTLRSSSDALRRPAYRLKRHVRSWTWHVRLCHDTTFFLLLSVSRRIRRGSRSQKNADDRSTRTQCLTLFFDIRKFSSFMRRLYIYPPSSLLPVPSLSHPSVSLLLPSHLHCRSLYDIGKPSLKYEVFFFSFGDATFTRENKIINYCVKRDVPKFGDLTLITVSCIYKKLKPYLSQQHRIQKDLQTRSWTKRDYVHWLGSLETEDVLWLQYRRNWSRQNCVRLNLSTYEMNCVCCQVEWWAWMSSFDALLTLYNT